MDGKVCFKTSPAVNLHCPQGEVSSLPVDTGSKEKAKLTYALKAPVNTSREKKIIEEKNYNKAIILSFAE